MAVKAACLYRPKSFFLAWSMQKISVIFDSLHTGAGFSSEMLSLAVLIALVSSSTGSCPEERSLRFFDKERGSCGYPLNAVVQYLTADWPALGPCSMFDATDRFDRYREWINSLTGYVSDKITFRRGYFVDPSTGRLNFSVGGAFLNPNEILVPGEYLFLIPFVATFNNQMIARVLPSLTQFRYRGSYRLWTSFGLARFLRHHPEVIGPWQAVLPDMRDHPLFYTSAQMDLLQGTQAYSAINSARQYIFSGCKAFHDVVIALEISCMDVMEALAIMMSRAFGVEPDTTFIPFGLDFLNHNPITKSHTGIVRYGSVSMPSRVDTIFWNSEYVLSSSREIFNNYGKHSLPGTFVMYGFTAPDPVDELVIVATNSAAFEGTPIKTILVNQCPSKIDFQQFYPPSSKQVCDSKKPDDFDTAGLFRMVNADLVAFVPELEFVCEQPVNGPLWNSMENRLRDLNVKTNGKQLLVSLNTYEGLEPWVDHPSSAWLAMCALPFTASRQRVGKVISDLSTCPTKRDEVYLEEYPINLSTRSLARTTLLKTCWCYEYEVLGSVRQNLILWVAYRNARILRTNREPASRPIGKYLDYDTHEEFLALLHRIMFSKTEVLTDDGGILDLLTIRANHGPLASVIRREEIYKYIMQSGQLVKRKCREPLQKVVGSGRSW